MATTYPMKDLRKGVMSFGVATVIDAPRNKVWAVLTDFEKYHEWFVHLSTFPRIPEANKNEGTSACKSSTLDRFGRESTNL